MNNRPFTELRLHRQSTEEAGFPRDIEQPNRPMQSTVALPSPEEIDRLISSPDSSGQQLATLTRALLRSGDCMTARDVMDAALERGGDEVAHLATFTEKRDGVAYGRMRLILGRTPTSQCLALLDLGVLQLMKGDVSGAHVLFRRAVTAMPSNREGGMWFKLLEQWGEHLSQFFLQDRTLPKQAARLLYRLLPDASNGYQSPMRKISRLDEPVTKAA